MQVETHVLGEIFARRYGSPDPRASHQLMLFHTAEFSTALQDFVLAHI
jgi:hypothetical protein